MPLVFRTLTAFPVYAMTVTPGPMSLEMSVVFPVPAYPLLDLVVRPLLRRVQLDGFLHEIHEIDRRWTREGRVDATRCGDGCDPLLCFASFLVVEVVEGGRHIAKTFAVIEVLLTESA